MRLTIDCETRSPVDLKKCGEWVYAADPRTDVLCVALKPDNEMVRTWCPDWVRHKLPANTIRIVSLETVVALIEQADEIEAHNASFERVIWQYILAPRYGWPALPLEKLRCSLAKCSMHALPRSLDMACKALELPVQKDDEGYRLMLRMCKPRKPTKSNPAKWVQDPWPLKKLIQYCIQDVEAEYALSQALADLPPLEQKLWYLDQEINARGVQVDLESAQAVIQGVETWTERLVRELQELTGGRVRTAKQVAVLREYLQSQGLELEDLTKTTIKAALEAGGHSEKVRRLLEIRTSLAQSSVSKYEALIRQASDDGRIRGTLLYHGASTGRFSGRKIQPQNLPRGSFKDVDAALDAFRQGDVDLVNMLWGDPMAAASTCIRGCLVAAPGHDLIACDFSSIEARALAWLAGEEKILDAFRSGLDLYKVAAQGVYGVPYDQITKEQRQIGKVVVLSSGYQGFTGAFQSMAKNYGVHVEDERAAEIVRAWRADNPKIVELWRALEDTALTAVLDQGQAYQYRGTYFKSDRRFLMMKMPSGRILYYYKPEVVERPLPWDETKTKKAIVFMGMDSMTNKFKRTATYGGKLSENLTQAISRDLLVYAMFRLEEAGYRTVLTVHDEVVLEVPEGFGSIEEVEGIMSSGPAWAAGLPLGAEGWRGKRYRK